MNASDGGAESDAGNSSVGDTRCRKGQSRGDRVLIAAVVGAVLPIIAAAADRLGSHWQPAGDEAAIARLSHDVLSSHSPLLGMPSTIGRGIEATGESPHHLGPMLFWLFAIPDRLSGSSPAALVITIALVNIASIAMIAWQVRRRAGSSAGVVAMLAVLVMLWSVGRDLTVQIWNPYAALLPLLLFLVLAWSVACGDLVALPLAALVGSFVMQCHVLYVLPVAGVGLVSAIALVMTQLDDRGARPRVSPASRARRRSFVATGLVLLVCWCTAVYDQIVHRPGNLTRLWDSFHGSHEKPFGTAIALRYATRAIAVPPLFARQFTDSGAFGSLGHRVGPSVTLSAVVVLGALTLGTISAWRRADTEAWLGVLALLTLGISFLVLARLPLEFGGVDAYRGRFLWIVGLYAWLALLLLVWRPVARIVVRLTSRRSELWLRVRLRQLAPAVTVVVMVAVVSIGALIARERSPAYAVVPDETVVVRKLSGQIRARVTHRGPYLLQVTGNRAFSGLGYAVMWDLVRHGHDIRVVGKDPYLGAAHGLGADAAVPRLLVVTSLPGFRAPPEAQRVAVVGSDDRLADRLRRAEAALVAALDRNGARLTAAGRRLLARAAPGAFADALSSLSNPSQPSSGSPPWHRLLNDQTLRALVLGKFVAIAPRDAEALSRFDRLLSRSIDSMISVFVVPPPT